MTTKATWHPGISALQNYVDRRTDSLSSASVEAHLLACHTCRIHVRDSMPARRLAEVLAAIDDRIDALERPRVERLVQRLGASEADARALLAAPSLRLGWWGAVALACALALLVARQDEYSRTIFLLLAPLLPLISTAVAYAPGLDPALAIVAATPYRTSRLLLARSFAVGATAALATCLAGLALPSRDLTIVLWLLPALALTLLVLALSRWLGTGGATMAVAGGWVLVVGALADRGMDPLVTFQRNGQLVSLLVAMTALTIVLGRRRTLDEGAPA